MASRRVVEAASENHDELVKELFAIFCRSRGGEDKVEDVVARVKSLIERGVDVDAASSAGHHEIGTCTIVLAAVAQHVQGKHVGHSTSGLKNEQAIIEGLNLVLEVSKDPEKLLNARSFEADKENKFHGLTPAIWASMCASLPLLKWLVKAGCDLTLVAPNLRIDAVRGAKTFGMDGSEKVIAYLEAVLQEEAMVLETVEDVARWIEDNAPFSASEKWIKIVVDRIRDRKVDAKTFFDMSDEEYIQMVCSADLKKLNMDGLDVQEQHWIHPRAFQRASQNDAKQIPAFEAAAKAVKSVRNKQVEEKLCELQRAIVSGISAKVAQQKVGTADMIKAAVRCFQDIQMIGNSEIERIENLIETCENKYSLLAERYDMLKKVDHNADSVDISFLVQPVRRTWNGVEESPLQIEGNTSLQDAALFHYVNSDTYYKYFSGICSEIENEMNSVESPKNLGLGDKFLLPFLKERRFLVNGQKRTSCRVGPIKSLSRATIKAGSDYVPPDRPAEIEGKPMSPADYVLDWLRATYVAEDPYVLASLHEALNVGRFPMLQLIRTKNNTSKKTHNLLCNYQLLYPLNGDMFREFKDRYDAFVGDFEPSLAGMPLACVEIQFMLFDFLKIKKIQHKYYEIKRCNNSYMPLVKTPVFIKSWEKEMYESKLEAKDAVIKDKEEEIERLKEELQRRPQLDV